jgi:CheY-like chemotaxis protein
MILTVLVVDDDASVRKSLLRLLTASGYNAVGAADGFEALRKAVQLRPDLILMDLRMPGPDGIGVTRTLREHSQLKDIPVIALSALAPAPEDEKMFAQVLLKPASHAELLAAIERARSRLQE